VNPRPTQSRPDVIGKRNKQQTQKIMKKKIATILLTTFSFCNVALADIAPNPIVVKSVFTVDSCKIRMLSEIVIADLYRDSAKVECIFEMVNYGDSITIEIGFPEMNFQYWGIGKYSENDKANFEIYVDDYLLTDEDIGVPEELEEVYQKIMHIYRIGREYNAKRDSIYKANNVRITKNEIYFYPSRKALDNTNKALDSLDKWRQSEPRFTSELWKEFNAQKKKGNYPWYVWKVHFKEGERKIIKVTYNLPSGMGYGANYRYFKYLLNTGAGWYKDIEKADIILNLNDINIENIEEISPTNYFLDTQKKTITWNFRNLEPTEEDDIFVRYFDTNERKRFEKHQEKRRKALKKHKKKIERKNKRNASR
jgi:hypothetical protein